MRFLLFLLSFIVLLAGNERVQHQRSIFVYAGKMHEIELNIDGNFVNSVQLFYRTNHADNYESVHMEKNGFDFSASVFIPKENYTELQYYFVYRDQSFLQKSLPGRNPVTQPYKSNIVMKQQDINFNYEIISPLLNETVDTEDFMVVVSLLDISPQVDISRTQLLVDGNMISSADISVDYIMYVPEITYGNGTHNIEIAFFNKDGETINKIEWSANVRGVKESGINATAHGRLSVRGLNDKSGPTGIKRDYTNVNANLYGKLSILDYSARAFISSQDDKLLQPINRYHGRLSLPFGKNSFVRAGFGDVSNTFTNNFILNNRNIRGIEASLYLDFVNIDFIKGNTKKGIVAGDSTSSNNSYKRESLAGRLSFGHSNSDFELGLSFIKSEDIDVNNSINLMNDDPKETLTAGVDLNLRLLDKRINISGGFNASVHQDNIRPAPITYQQLKDNNIDISESVFDLANKFITIRSIPDIGRAFYGAFTMNLFSNYMKVKYEKVSSDFKSEGNPFMLSGYTLLSVYDNLRLIENQLFLSLSYDMYTFNVESDNPNKDNRLTAGVTYFPSNIAYPTISVKFSNYDQVLTDTIGTENSQATSMVNLEVSKDFQLANMMHNAIVIFGTSTKDAGSKAESNLLQFGLQSELGVLPITTRIQYSNFESGSQVNLEKTNEFSLRANYDLKSLFKSKNSRFDIFAQFNTINSDNSNSNKTLYENYKLTGIEFGTSFTHPFKNRTSLNSRIRFRSNSIKPELSDSYTNSLFTYSIEYKF